MKQIEYIIARHADNVNLDVKLSLTAWDVERFETEDSLVNYLDNELISIWRFGNGQSMAGLCLSKRGVAKFFWRKRPTSVEIKYTDGSETVHDILYPDGMEGTRYWLTDEDRCLNNDK